MPADSVASLAAEGKARARASAFRHMEAGTKRSFMNAPRHSRVGSPVDPTRWEEGKKKGKSPLFFCRIHSES